MSPGYLIQVSWRMSSAAGALLQPTRVARSKPSMREQRGKALKQSGVSSIFATLRLSIQFVLAGLIP